MKAQDFTFIVKNGSVQDGVKFVVEYPEFPGISGGSDDMLEAIREAQEALQMFIDYRLKEKREVIEKKSGRITLRIPSTMHFICEELSKIEGVSLNTFLIDAVSQKIYSYKHEIRGSSFFKINSVTVKPTEIKDVSVYYGQYYEGESDNGKQHFIQ